MSALRLRLPLPRPPLDPVAAEPLGPLSAAFPLRITALMPSYLPAPAVLPLAALGVPHLSAAVQSLASTYSDADAEFPLEHTDVVFPRLAGAPTVVSRVPLPITACGGARLALDPDRGHIHVTNVSNMFTYSLEGQPVPAAPLQTPAALPPRCPPVATRAGSVLVLARQFLPVRCGLWIRDRPTDVTLRPVTEWEASLCSCRALLYARDCRQVVAFVPAWPSNSRLLWLDEDGRCRRELLLPTRPNPTNCALSPCGTVLAVLSRGGRWDGRLWVTLNRLPTPDQRGISVLREFPTDAEAIPHIVTGWADADEERSRRSAHFAVDFARQRLHLLTPHRCSTYSFQGALLHSWRPPTPPWTVVDAVVDPADGSLLLLLFTDSLGVEPLELMRLRPPAKPLPVAVSSYGIGHAHQLQTLRAFGELRRRLEAVATAAHAVGSRSALFFRDFLLQCALRRQRGFPT